MRRIAVLVLAASALTLSLPPAALAASDVPKLAQARGKPAETTREPGETHQYVRP